MVLIISHQHDTHAKAVAKEIIARGEKCFIFDISDFGCGGMLHFGNSVNDFISNSKNEKIFIPEIKSIWNRRPKEPQINETVIGRENREFANREWRNAYEGLFKTVNIRMVNPVHTSSFANKPLQLSLAKKFGFNIPETVITNSKEDVINLYNKYNGQIIHKSLTSTSKTFIQTKLFKETDFQFLDNLIICPAIFQELITGKYDYRVTVIGNKVFTARISTYQNPSLIDSRLDLNLKYESYNFSKSVNNKIIRLLRELNLEFASLDFKLSRDKKLYFLEINPQGQFIYIQLLTGLPLVKEMADFLIGN
jgi:glutathione synthase/RimK-type ligase-like ATP-grasp enzyme